MMRFWFSGRGVALLLVGAGLLVGVSVTTLRVAHLTSPERRDASSVDLSSLSIDVEKVGFPSSDGISLSAWWMLAGEQAPTLILCHDRGRSKASLINLAIALRDAGFSVLLFDFRGHGESAEARSTYGVKEMRDVLGAIDFVQRRTGDGGIGLYGAGMGAYAAVNAAAARPAVRALVLDALYPDARYRLVRDVFGGWQFGERRLAFLPQGVFELLCGVDPGEPRAEEAIRGLAGRELLLLAPADDTALVSEMRKMYEAVPDHPDVEGNFTVLPGTLGRGLYGERVRRYHARVLDFFRLRLIERETGA